MRAVMLILLAATLAGCVSEQTDFETAQAPVWQAGHAYSYNMAGEASTSAKVMLNGETVDQDSQTEPIPPTPYMHFEVLTNQSNIDGSPFYLVAAVLDGAISPFGGFGTPTALAIRQSDLAPFPIQLEPLQVLGDTGWVYLDFPLAPGKTWSYFMENTAQGDDLVGDFDMRAEATKAHTVATPLGDMATIQVVTRAGFPDMAGMAAEVKAEFEAAGFTDVKINVDPKLTVVTDYAPAIKNMATETTLLKVYLRVQFKDGSDAYDITTNAAVTLTSTVTGASLGTLTDLGQAGAVQALIGGRMPVDVDGVATVPVDDVTLEITATETEVNAADSNSVDFSITATGVPDNMFVAYDLVDATGAILVDGEGTAFSHSFTDPGIHYARASVTDGAGYTVALASVPVVADYKTAITATCTAVSLSTTVNCDAVAIPLRPGQFTASITVDAKSAGTVGLPGSVDYVQAGKTAAAETTNGEVTLSLDSFPGAANDGSIAWTPAAAGVMEEVVFTIDLDYGTPEAESLTAATFDWHSPLEDLLADLGFEIDL